MSASNKRDRFESPKLLLEEARANIDDVKSGLDAYFAADPHAVVVDLEPETGYKLYKIKIVADVPGNIRVRAHSAITHMRHALDQACYQAAILLAPGGGRSCTNFVFGDDPANLNKLLVTAGKHIPPALHGVIRSLEPYRTGEGHAGGNDKFWVLGKIAGPTKHRTIIEPVPSGAGFALNEMVIRPTADCPAGGRIESTGEWDPEKHEMTVLRAPATTEVHFHVEPHFMVTFRNEAVPEINGAPVIGALETFLSIATSAVQAIEAETLRLYANSTPDV